MIFPALGTLLALQGSEHRVVVHNTAELRRAVAEAKPGTRIELQPGRYTGGLYFENLHGAPGRPIVIAGASTQEKKMAWILRGSTGIHLSRVSYVELHNLGVAGAEHNGINVDDGGPQNGPSHHVVLRGLVVHNIGHLRGNHDGIKLSGVDDFRVEGSLLQHWGGDGSGIDMVGCRRGRIQRNALSFFIGEMSGGSGVQTKGGSRDILIRRNRFHIEGPRAINIGGSTGLKYFRPPLGSWPKGEPKYEAKDIRIEGNTFIDSDAPVAFVGVDGAAVRFNTIYRPQRWAMRILQETREPGFVPSRNGVFTDNLIVFRSDKWFEGGVNVGPHTAPQTFRFARNFWFCEDKPERSRPRLPAAEVGGVYGVDPQLRRAAEGTFRPHPQGPARKVGATALPQ